MHKIPVIRLYFPLDAVHVSDYISPSSGENFYKLYIAFGICRNACLLCGYSHTTDRLPLWGSKLDKKDTKIFKRNYVKKNVKFSI